MKVLLGIRCRQAGAISAAIAIHIRRDGGINRDVRGIDREMIGVLGQFNLVSDDKHGQIWNLALVLDKMLSALQQVSVAIRFKVGC